MKHEKLKLQLVCSYLCISLNGEGRGLKSELCGMCALASRVLIFLLTKQRVHQQQIPLQLFRGFHEKWMTVSCRERVLHRFLWIFQLSARLQRRQPGNWFLSAMTVDHCVCLVIGLDHNYWAAESTYSATDTETLWCKLLAGVYCTGALYNVSSDPLHDQFCFREWWENTKVLNKRKVVKHSFKKSVMT